MTVRTIAAALALAASLAARAQVAAVPHTFTAGTPARAAEVNDNFADLAGRIAALLPVGTVLPYAGKGDTPPAGFFFCDGHSLSIVSYPALFAALGNTYGGDGTTNFFLPNLQARFPVGAGPGTGGTFDPALGSSGGSAKHTLTINEMPSHAHAHRYQYCRTGDNCLYHTNTAANLAAGNDGDTAQTVTGTGAVQPAGSGFPFDSVPPYVTIRWIIKY